MSELTCCGKPRKTRFCPDCGEKLWALAGPEELAKFLRRRAASLAGDADSEVRSPGYTKELAWVEAQVARRPEK